MPSLMTKNLVTLDQVKAVPVPEHTKSWKPIPYGDTIDFIKELVGNMLPYEIRKEEYGLNKAGNQMFGVLTLDSDDDQGMALGVRGSYDKSLAWGTVGGSSVMVCDNLCFSGEAFRVVRRNTVNVWADFRQMVVTQIQQSEAHYQSMKLDRARMDAMPVTTDRGYEILGRAVGEQVLSPNQASVAFSDWREPRHQEFSPRNLWSLYNCATEGMKKGSPGGMVDRYTNAHEFFMALPPPAPMALPQSSML